MAGQAWYYVRDDQRMGPVHLQELRELLTRGQVPPHALVWTAGMPQWTPAAQTPALSSPTPIPSQSTAAAPAHPAHPPHDPAHPAPAPTHPAHPAPVSSPPPTAAVAYYGMAAGIPQRAMEALKGHARPVGDTGDWPLDDHRIEQFRQAIKLRKKVTGAAQLYRLLLFLSAISLGVTVLVAIFMLLNAPRGGAGAGAFTAGVTAFAMIIAFSAGFTALYYFAWRATMRAHRWAPLTMFIIFLALALLYALVLLMPGQPPEAAAGGIILAILFAIFAAVSWTSFAAIPKYTAQPAWCQELIVQAGM